MLRIEGVVQHYEWGDTEYLPGLLGSSFTGRPCAEWWLGTHHGGPATLADHPDHPALGTVVGELPFLLKVLAAAAPLSMQVHPSASQARAAYDADTARGWPSHDPRRQYRDPHAKPEVLCALEPFEVLCGFRPVDESLAALADLGGGAAASLADALRVGGISGAIEAVLVERRIDPFDLADQARRAAVTTPPMPQAKGRPGTPRPADTARSAPALRPLLCEIAARYPGDVALGLAPLLHHRLLAPGEAVYLGAGTLHAYVRGVGVELMDPSDNVLRAGLTVKPVDVAALQEVVNPVESPDPVINPNRLDGSTVEYPTPTEWRLRRIDLDGEYEVAVSAIGVMIVTAGAITQGGRGSAFLVRPGDTVMLRGQATIHWATGSTTTSR